MQLIFRNNEKINIFINIQLFFIELLKFIFFKIIYLNINKLNIRINEIIYFNINFNIIY